MLECQSGDRGAGNAHNPRAVHRYHRQTLLPPIGLAGQERLRSSHALIVGCGALGSAIADTLARGGVGTLTIVDRDVVEITNLQRQVLFDEDDLADGMPKAEAARRKLSRVNSDVAVHAVVEDFTARNAERLAGGCDLILDGLDNFQARYLINDLAVARGVPYVYGGAVATTGASMTVLPHPACRRTPAPGGHIAWTDAQATSCLRCVFPEAPPAGASPTCDTAGVLAPVVAIVAAHQSTQAIKLMTGNIDAVDRSLLSIDVWTNETRRFDMSKARTAGRCPCCVDGRFEHLDAVHVDADTALCGRGAVQITPSRGGAVDLDGVLSGLSSHGAFERKAYVVRGTFAHERGDDGAAIELTVFQDGRALVKGLGAVEAARSIYARYVGM